MNDQRGSGTVRHDSHPTAADTKRTAHLSSGRNANTCSGGTRFESRFRFVLAWPKSAMALLSASASVTTPGWQLVHQDRPLPGLLPCRLRLISRLTQTAPFHNAINKSKTRFETSTAAMYMKSSLVWGAGGVSLLVVYRRFGTDYWSHLQESSSLVPKRRPTTANIRFVTTRKSQGQIKNEPHRP